MLDSNVKPDGYVPAGTAGMTILMNEPPYCGYTGTSTKAARADHVHPLNIDNSRPPQPIGMLPLPSGTQKTRLPTDGDLTQGVYGQTGIPSSSGANSEKSKTYSLSNHVHAYGFVTGVTGDTPFMAVRDGAYVVTDLNIYQQTGNYSLLMRVNMEIGESDGSYKYGSLGRIPFPARLDHTHPLNVADLQVIGDTGSTGDYVKPIGDSPSHGTSPFYARVDHVHKYKLGDIQTSGKTEGDVAAIPDGKYVGLLSEDTTGDVAKVTLRGVLTNSSIEKEGYAGDSKIPARYDHVHPLNLADLLISGATGQTGAYVKPVGAEAKHGTSPFYARVDHVHSMPTGNNTYVPASTWSLISGNSDTTTYSAVLKTNTWTRGSTKIDDKPAGFKCEILTRCIRPNVSGRAGPKDIFIFREFTFDENGCVKAVSAEKYAFSEWNGLKKPV